MDDTKNIELYTKYPVSNVLLYNGTTIAHFLLGGIGIAIGYNSSWTGPAFGAAYIILAFAQMYIIMPMSVCPNCVYYRMEGSVCTSGLNVISKMIARPGDTKNFSRRGDGLLRHNTLYLAALFVPIIAIIPALILNFSIILMVTFIVLVGALLLRFFVIFTKTACVHCRAKNMCPNAKAMRLHDPSSGRIIGTDGDLS